MSTFKLTRATTLTRERLCRELGCTYIYGVGGKQERAYHRYTRGILTVVVADDIEGTNARFVSGIYSRHKEEWVECCFPTQRQPTKKIVGVVLGIAVF